MPGLPAGARRRRWRHRVTASVSPHFFPGICGASGSIASWLLNWTYAGWQVDCSQSTHGKAPLCYRVDRRDPHSDVGAWQEIERITFERWRAAPFAIDAAEQDPDLVIVPSALAHCRASGRYAQWQDAMTDGRTDVHEAYWAALFAAHGDGAGQAGGAEARLDHRHANQTSSTPPLIVIHYDGTWQMEFGRAMLTTLAKLPAPFVRRIILCSIESALQLRPYAHLFREPRAAPRFVTVPFTILTAGPIVAAAKERHGRPVALLFSGRPHASYDRSRARVHALLLEAGATCLDGRDGRVTCLLCADAVPRGDAKLGRQGQCAQRALDGIHIRSFDDPALSLGSLGVLALASRATLCLEPTSDTLVRSHFYAAALAGCVPVAFDTDLAADGKPYPQPPYRTEWAWRIHGVPRTLKPQTLVRLPGGLAAERMVNFSRYAVVHEVDELRRGTPNVISELLDLATNMARRSELRRYQRALAVVAPLLRFDPGPSADAGVKDAVERESPRVAAPAVAPAPVPVPVAPAPVPVAVPAAGASHQELCPGVSPVPCDAFSMLVLYLQGLRAEDRSRSEAVPWYTRGRGDG